MAFAPQPSTVQTPSAKLWPVAPVSMVSRTIPQVPQVVVVTPASVQVAVLFTTWIWCVHSLLVSLAKTCTGTLESTIRKANAKLRKRLNLKLSISCPQSFRIYFPACYTPQPPLPQPAESSSAKHHRSSGKKNESPMGLCRGAWIYVPHDTFSHTIIPPAASNCKGIVSWFVNYCLFFFNFFL